MKVGVKIEGLDSTLRAFNQYGRDANKELRQAAGVHADHLVAMLTTAGNNAGKGAALAAGSVKRKSDRVPAITAGGSRKVKSSTGKVTAGDVFFGYEFGGGRRPTTRQFPPWLGRVGYWFWPLIRREMPALRRAYLDTLEDLARKWAAGGNQPG
jgi:hypothetical protein